MSLATLNKSNSSYIFSTKTLGQPREIKNGLVMLKFDTLVDWMNTPGV